MDNNSAKRRTRDAITAARVKRVADLTGVSTRSVQRVITGNQKNEEVLSAFMLLAEEENKLLNAVKSLVPFPSNTSL